MQEYTNEALIAIINNFLTKQQCEYRYTQIFYSPSNHTHLAAQIESWNGIRSQMAQSYIKNQRDVDNWKDDIDDF